MTATVGIPSYVASAAGLTLFGHNLLGEALLVFGGLAAGAALTYGLARAAGGSALVAIVGVAMQALAYPRTYSYPKLFLHALAIALCWRYLERPSLGRRAGLAALVAVAFLFRPDHGVVIGLVALVAIVWADAGTAGARARTACGFAAATAAFLLPWLIFVQSTTGLVQHARSVMGFTGTKAAVGSLHWPPFPIELPLGPGQAIGLNHEAFLYYTFLLLPVAGAVVLWRRGAGAAPMPDAASRLAIVIILAICVNATLLRQPLANRLADVAVPQIILAAWLFPAAWRAVRGSSLGLQVTLRTGTAIIVCLLVLSTIRLGAARDRFGEIPVLKPAALLTRAALVTWGLREIDASSGIPRPMPPPRLVGYLQECTEPGDRVMYVGYAPETYFFARRGFAGGHVVFEGTYYASAEEQALTISRLQRERVPVIAIRDEPAPVFRGTFNAIAAYIDTNYVRVGTIGLPSDQHEGVFVDRRLAPEGVYEPLGFACFARK